MNSQLQDPSFIPLNNQNAMDEIVNLNREVELNQNENFNGLDEIVPATSIKLDLTGQDDWRDNNISTAKKSIWVIKMTIFIFNSK